MSANNWRVCPACKRRLEVEQAARAQAVRDAYGKVSAEQYEEMRCAAEEVVADLLEKTMREDWEIGTGRDGKFFVSYRAKCKNCRFDYSFKHEAQTLEKA
jgi:hypothetical protein